MFQTQINHFLQSFESKGLTFFMQLITSLGNELILIIILITIISGINFRKGFLLIQIVIITGLLTQIAKHFFALPRPWFVDSGLTAFNKKLVTDFSYMDSKSFFGYLPQNVIDSYRLLKPDSFGFPSGHTSSAVALWASVIVLFRKKFVIITSISFLILIPVSRLYLARHFLADILAGYFLGFFVLLVFYFAILKLSVITSYLKANKIRFALTFKSAYQLFYLLVLPVIFLFVVPDKYSTLSGYLIGINIAFLAIGLKQFPIYSSSIFHGVYRVLITIIVFVLIGSIVTFCYKYLFFSSLFWGDFFVGAFITSTGTLLSAKLIRYVKLSS